MNNIKINNKFYYILFIISFLFILTKYFLSFLIFPNEYLFQKIIRLSDTEYFNIVESFSRLDLYTDWNKFEIAEKIIGFPIFSIILHSIFFKFFSYYSFLILEIILFFFIIFLLFLIFNEFKFNNITSLLGILILLIIIQFINFIEPSHNNILHKLRLPIQEFIGIRFPRPIITSIFVLTIFYNLLKIINKNNFTESKKLFLIISILLIFLLNSFFYLFICLFFLTFYYLIKLLYKNQKIKIKYEIKFLIYIFFSICLGFFIFLYQQNLSELDYANRIGVYKINFKEKIFLLNKFLNILIKNEYILIISASFFFKYYNSKKKNKNNYKLFFNFLFFSLVSPFIFIIFTNKVISLYHFLTIIKFSSFFYIYISLLNNLNIFLKKIKILKIKIIFFFIILFQILNILISLNFEKKTDNQFVKDTNEIITFLKENYIKTNYTLMGPNEIIFFWLHLKNKFFLTPSGFETSLSDNQLEKIIFLELKILNISKYDFVKILNDRTCGRECFAIRFNYKYSVNALRHYKPIINEYSSEDLVKILSISPVVWWNTIIPYSEKNRLIENYKNFNFDIQKLPEIIILRKSSKFTYLNKFFNYYLVFKNNNYFVFIRKFN